MQEGEIALIDEILRTREHLFCLGREACDDIGPQRDIGAQPPHLRAEFDRVLPRMPALHPLQNHVVAGLQRQMQMRHQPLIFGDDVEQIAIGFDGIDR